MRKRLWQLHSWLGLVAGLGLLIMGLSGSLLMFHEELEQVFNPEFVRVSPTAAGRLSPDELRTAVESQLSGYEITGWLYQYDQPELADVIYTIAHGSDEWLLATVDPYTGRLLATPREPRSTLTGWLLELHYTLFADHVGLLVVAIFGLLLCLLGVSGVWIYREFWKNLFTLRWGRGARIFCSDLHKAVGISSVAFNLVLGFTGTFWNITHLAAEGWFAEHEHTKLPGRLYPDTLSLNTLFADGSERIPGFRANYVSFPWEPGLGFTLWGAVEPRGVLRSPYGSTVAYDVNGGYTAHDDLRTASVWRQILDAFRPLHFGDFGGWPIKILWALGGLTPGILAVSGFLIWRSRRKRPTPVPPRPATLRRRDARRVASSITEPASPPVTVPATRPRP